MADWNNVTMKKLNFYKNRIYLSFIIDDDGRLDVLNIGRNNTELEPNRFFVPVEVFATGENPDDHHGAKHTGSRLSDTLKYVSRTETDSEILFVLENNKIRVIQHYEFPCGASAVRSYAEIENISAVDIGLEYVSSFCMYGFEIDRIWLCHNAWCRELEWRGYAPSELGYSRITEFSSKRISVSNTGTWSTKEFMPMGIIQNQNECIFWQTEHNGSWNFEISDIKNVNYLKLSGPSEQENRWWKNLKSGERFTTVAAAVAFSADIDGAIEEMTKYRRELAYQSPSDVDLPVIFNDYMMCLNADPTTEKELPVIDAAARLGAEIYCMDAGWYADGTWWETVGEWQVCESRFPNGIKEVFDYIRQKGMKPGIWLEPESIGINCPILDNFSDECFFMRHGKRIIDHGRYQLDFRCKRVTEFLDSVVDRLINELGIEYFKFDYNIDGGAGTENDSDSFGDGLMRHGAAYLNWIDGIYARYPNLIIENCASGGMRMDYKTLSHFSVQSTSDATDYKPTAAIAAMSGTAVLPRQAQVWVLPMRNHTDGEIIINTVNAMFKRPAVSGETHLLNEKQFKLLKQGIDFYKLTRTEIPKLIPFYPCGAVNFEDEVVVCGYKGEGHSYICIENLSDTDREITVPLMDYTDATCVYPTEGGIKTEIAADVLKVHIHKKSAAIIKTV